MFDFAGWGSSAIAARLASGREDKSRRAARAADPEKEISAWWIMVVLDI